MFDFEEKIKDSFARQKFMNFIGGKVVKVEDGFCEIHLPFKEELTQQHGFFHAGVISTLADNAAGYAAFSKMDANSSILTVEFKLNLMSPGDGEMLIAKAKVLKSGKTLTICRADVFVIKNGKEKLCAAAQSTLIQLHNQDDN